MTYPIPTKLDRLMQVVAEHHPIEDELRLQIDNYCVWIESNSKRLLSTLAEHFRPGVRDELSHVDLRFVAIEAATPDLGLVFTPDADQRGTARNKEEYAEVDGGRVVRKALTGLQFLLGPDMTLAVGACERYEDQIVDWINAFRTHAVHA